MTMLYHQIDHIDTRIIRIFNTYGPRMSPTDGRVVSNFINQAISGKNLTVYGDGLQTRSFCFISDLVEGIMKAMFSEGTTGEIFNLGNPTERTVNDLALLILKLTASKSQIVNEKLPEDDPERRQPDISKAKQILNWEPLVTAEEGIKKTIAYYRELKNG